MNTKSLKLKVYTELVDAEFTCCNCGYRKCLDGTTSSETKALVLNDIPFISIETPCDCGCNAFKAKVWVNVNLSKESN